jgi:Fe-S cluster biosynthesis and repair protein YggX
MIKGRRGEDDIRLSELIASLRVIFSINDEKISPIINAWADYQTTLINNRIVDIQNRLHKEGITVELSASQYNTLMDDEDKLNPNRW